MIVKNQRDEHSADALLYTSRNLSTVTFSASFTGVQCVRACVRACVCARVCVCVCVCKDRSAPESRELGGQCLCFLVSLTRFIITTMHFSEVVMRPSGLFADLYPSLGKAATLEAQKMLDNFCH